MNQRTLWIGMFVLVCVAGMGEAQAEVPSDSSSVEVGVDSSAAATDDSATVAISNVWMNSVWKRASKLAAKQRAFEVEKVTAVAGVRGEEAQDEVLKRLYYMEKTRRPNRAEMKEVVQLLMKQIASKPKDTAVPEIRYLIAQCYLQLGDTEKALDAYEELIRRHAASTWAKKAKAEVVRLKEITP